MEAVHARAAARFLSSHVLSRRHCRYIVSVSRVVVRECEMPAAQATAGEFDPRLCQPFQALLAPVRSAVRAMWAGHRHGPRSAPWDKGGGTATGPREGRGRARGP